MKKERILILGVTGMLGHTLFKEMNKNDSFEVFGTTRNKSGLEGYFTEEELFKIRDGVDADNFETVIRAIASVQPTIIINCIGIIKQLPISKDPLTAITVNAQLPHRLSLVTRTAKARLIHISTDCVFDGKKGNYTEKDLSNAEDLYGKTKYLGEVIYPHCITLRTSIIGHELKTNYSLVDWFMSQEDEINGFTKAIYSGFPTIEMVNIISNYVIPNKELSGLYHVSSDKISKYKLLNIMKDVYKKNIKINTFDDFELDRSLNSDRFKDITGYITPSWEQLIRDMFNYFKENNYNQNNKKNKWSEFLLEDKEIFKQIEKIREEIKTQNIPIILKDYGAGNPKDNRDEKQMYEGVEKRTNSFDLCSIGLKNEWAQKLYFLVKDKKPKNILELGTCCGFSSIYMSKANKDSNIFTIEGDCNVAQLAANNIKKANCTNIKQYIGKFQDILQLVLEEIKIVDFAFIDGHHDKNATIKYFEKIKPYLTDNSIVVFDDIIWSDGMEEAWNIIKKDKIIDKVDDLKKLGICYINKGKLHDMV